MSLHAVEVAEEFFSPAMLAAAFTRLGEVEDRMVLLRFPATMAEAMERFDLLFELYDARCALQLAIRAPEAPSNNAVGERNRVLELQL